MLLVNHRVIWRTTLLCLGRSHVYYEVAWSSKSINNKFLCSRSGGASEASLFTTQVSVYIRALPCLRVPGRHSSRSTFAHSYVVTSTARGSVQGEDVGSGALTLSLGRQSVPPVRILARCDPNWESVGRRRFVPFRSQARGRVWRADTRGAQGGRAALSAAPASNVRDRCAQPRRCCRHNRIVCVVV